jgi:hypothetical protein
MDTFLTLVIALGGITTGIGAIWAAMLARRQGRVTEQSLREQLKSFQEQNKSFQEQNERARLSLEVDMLLKFYERFQGKGLSQSETRRSAAKHIKDNFFRGDNDLLEVDHLNKAGEDVLNFFELMGLLVRAATIDERLVQELFAFRLVRYWELCKPAVERAREEDRSPDLWVNFEDLANRMIALAKEDGGLEAEGFTKTQLRRFVEEEAVAGFEDIKEA